MRRYETYVGLIRSTAIAASLAFGSASFLLAEEPATPPAPADTGVQERAVPSTGRCSITTYYSDAAKTKQVGTFSTCPGQKRGLTGRKTHFYEVETFEFGAPGVGKPPGPGSLPCEFQKAGCSDIPGPRN